MLLKKVFKFRNLLLFVLGIRDDHIILTDSLKSLLNLVLCLILAPRR